MGVGKNIKKMKTMVKHAISILVNPFSMTLKKDGHVVIKLFMTGMNLKKYQNVLQVSTPI